MSVVAIEWFEAAIEAVRARGRDFEAPGQDLTTSEVEQLTNSFRLGRTPEEAAHLLGGGQLTPRPWLVQGEAQL